MSQIIRTRVEKDSYPSPQLSRQLSLPEIMRRLKLMAVNRGVELVITPKLRRLITKEYVNLLSKISHIEPEDLPEWCYVFCGQHVAVTYKQFYVDRGGPIRIRIEVFRCLKDAVAGVLTPEQREQLRKTLTSAVAYKLSRRLRFRELDKVRRNARYADMVLDGTDGIY